MMSPEKNATKTNPIGRKIAKTERESKPQSWKTRVTFWEGSANWSHNKQKLQQQQLKSIFTAIKKRKSFLQEIPPRNPKCIYNNSKTIPRQQLTQLPLTMTTEHFFHCDDFAITTPSSFKLIVQPPLDCLYCQPLKLNALSPQTGLWSLSGLWRGGVGRKLQFEHKIFWKPFDLWERDSAPWKFKHFPQSLWY